MFRKRLLSLSTAARNQYKTLTFHDQINCETINYADVRLQIADFFLFLRDSVKK